MVRTAPIRWSALLALTGTLVVGGAQAQNLRHRAWRMNMQAAQVHHPPVVQQNRPQPEPARTEPVVRSQQTQQRPAPQNVANGQQNHSAPVERQAPAGAGAPIERREPPPPNATVRANPKPAAGVQFRGDHIADWMDKHKNLNPEQQQQALEHEPGFHDMPPVVQQHLRDRLAQLNAMPPAQRQQAITRIETLQNMSPEKRQQWRDAMQQWASLPADQKKAVKRSFLQLRQLPADQRNSAIASGRFTNGFTDAQRSSLNNLMRVEPWMPADMGGGH